MLSCLDLNENFVLIVYLLYYVISKFGIYWNARLIVMIFLSWVSNSFVDEDGYDGRMCMCLQLWSRVTNPFVDEDGYDGSALSDWPIRRWRRVRWACFVHACMCIYMSYSVPDVCTNYTLRLVSCYCSHICYLTCWWAFTWAYFREFLPFTTTRYFTLYNMSSW